MLHFKFGSCSSTVCSCRNVGATMTPKISCFAFQHSSVSATHWQLFTLVRHATSTRKRKLLLQLQRWIFLVWKGFSDNYNNTLTWQDDDTSHIIPCKPKKKKKKTCQKDLWYWSCSESTSHQNSVSRIVTIAHFFLIPPHQLQHSTVHSLPIYPTPWLTPLKQDYQGCSLRLSVALTLWLIGAVSHIFV